MKCGTDLRAEEVLNHLTHLAARLCAAPMALLCLKNGSRYRIQSVVGLSSVQMRIKASLLPPAPYDRDLLIVPDVLENAPFVHRPPLQSDPPARFFASAPLTASDGTPFGVLIVMDRMPRDLSLEQQESLRMVAGQVVSQLECRQAIKALESTLAQYREVEKEHHRLVSIVECSDDAIVSVNLDGLILSWNPGAEKLFGYTATEIIGQPVSRLVPSHRLEEVRENLKQLKRGESIQNVETERLHKDGTLVNVSVSVLPLKDEAGSITGFVGIMRDVSERVCSDHRIVRPNVAIRTLHARGEGIEDESSRPVRMVGTGQDVTAQKIAEQVLRESEERFRLLVENAQDLIYRYRLEPEEGFDYVSPASITITGYTPDEFYRDPDLWWTFMHSDNRELLKEHAGSSNQEPLLIRWIRKDGEQIWIEHRSMPIHNAAGTLIAIEGIARDVTASRKRAEAQFRDFLESLPAGVLMVKQDAILWVNSQVQQLFGYDREELIGKPVEILLAEDLREKHVRYRRAYFKDPRPRPMGIGLDLLGRRKDGSECPVEISLSPVQTEEGLEVIAVITDITERKRAEAALRESEERFRALSTYAPIGIFLADMEGHAIYTNPRSQEVGGFTFNKSLGYGWADFVHPEDRERVLQHWLSTVKQGANYVDDFRWVHPNGEVRWSRMQGAPVFADDGRIISYVGTVEDVTERRKAEMQLQQRIEQLQQIYHLNNVVGRATTVEEIYTASLDCLLRTMNANRASILLFDPDGVLRFKAWRGLSDEYRKAVEGHLPWAPDAKDPQPVIVANVAEDENLAPFRDVILGEGIQALGFVPLYAQEKLLGKFMIYYNDPHPFTAEEIRLAQTISRHVAFGIQRKLAEDALATEKERLTVTLRSIGDAVIATDAEGRIRLMNSIAEQLTGWSQAEAEGRPLSEVFQIVDEQTRQSCPNPVEMVLNSGKMVALPNDTLLIAHDGTEITIADSGAPIRALNGEVMGVVLVFRDVTEKRRLEEEILRANKLEALGVLAGGIAHDFNNILTAILGGLSLAQMMAPPDNPIQEHLRLTERACDQARALANQLLTFSASGAPLKSLVSIADLLRDSATFALHGSNVRCELDIPDDLWSIEAGGGQIGQVIHNLVLNADQAMPEGGILTVRAENLMLSEPQDLPLLPGAYVKIIIADRGVGIPADYLPRVFDPFFTTKARGKGLGLAIVYSVIRRHNGYVTVQSEPGVGTTFTIYLPASFKSAAPPQKPTEGTPQGEGRILLMDDEPLIRNITGELLKNLNYQAEFARDGSEAITLYEQALGNGQPFDAVILDLTVPGGMGGKEAIQKLRRIDPEVKAIVASGYSDDPVVAYYQEYGFVRAISKPYRLNELRRILNEVLGIGR